jgi:hypothetical protein
VEALALALALALGVRRRSERGFLCGEKRERKQHLETSKQITRGVVLDAEVFKEQGVASQATRYDGYGAKQLTGGGRRRSR